MKGFDRGHFIFTLLLVLFVLFILFASFEHRIKLRMVPIIVATPTLMFLICILLKDFFTKTKNLVGEEDVNPKLVMRIMGWIVAFAGAIFFLGFFVSVPLFIFVFLLTEGKLKWPVSMIASIALSCAFLAIFYLALKIDLWPGIFPEVLPKIFGGGLPPPL